MLNPKYKTHRLKIYKSVLKILENSQEKIFNQIGLCLHLQAIWANVNHFNDLTKDNDGNSICWDDMPKYFPEFAKYYPSTYPKHISGTNNLYQWRLETIKKMIKDITNIKKSSK